MDNLPNRIIVEEHPDNLLLRYNITRTAEKYFNCDAMNFDFREDYCTFNLWLGVFHICIEFNVTTGAWGYVSYGSHVREFEYGAASFEDICRKIHSFLKQEIKEVERGLV